MTRARVHEAAMVAWLSFVWVLLWGDVSWANVLAGVGVAVGIRVLLPLPSLPVRGRVHLPTLLRLLATVAADLVVSSAQLVWWSVRPGPPLRSAVVRSQLGVRSELVLALVVNTLNLVPGSVVLEIDQARRVLHTHVLGVRSAADLVAFQSKVSALEDLFIGAFEAPLLITREEPL